MRANRIVLVLTLCVPELLLAQELSATFQVESATAQPGDAVALSFKVRTNAIFEGFSFSLDFDEEVIEATEIAQVFERPDGEEWQFYTVFFDNSNDTPGNQGVNEGYLAGGAVFSLFKNEGQLPPPNQENTILRFHFLVKEDAPAGDTPLEFIEGGKTHPNSPGVENIATVVRTSVDPKSLIAAITVGGQIKVVPEADVTLFLRGDSDGNGKIEATDAIVTLSFLFLGAKDMLCLDAADANDDGIINISDAVLTLRYLFTGEFQIPPPISRRGEDPTPDALTCRVK